MGASLATWPNSPNTISGVLPGKYILRVFPNEDAYAKQVFLRGREVTNPDFELTMPGEMEIVLAAGGRTVTGTVPGSPSRWPDTKVILVPEQPRQGAFTTIYHGDVDQRGEFVIWSVIPGRYRSFFVTSFDEGLWENREFFQQIAEHGAVIEVPSGVSDKALRITPHSLPTNVVERAVTNLAH
jgi:hypothetical protein